MTYLVYLATYKTQRGTSRQYVGHTRCLDAQPRLRARIA